MNSNLFNPLRDQSDDVLFLFYGNLSTHFGGTPNFNRENCISGFSSAGQVCVDWGTHVQELHKPWELDREFIKLEQSFVQQIGKINSDLVDDNTFLLKERIGNISASLLSLQPSKISLQVTNENSIFYTLKLGNYSAYFEYFVSDADDDQDEAIISVFNHDENILNYGGSFDNAFQKLSKLSITNGKQLMYQSLHGLSH